ncbi:MAG TPA: efflux RND transporter periplasmic adaptor subunit [Candidatus Polarisedimenticolia bacterium]|nr:efflux RND transporter periplasmic adaptor subunit [Candidatus Polarisedimenticolia bacterium]
MLKRMLLMIGVVVLVLAAIGLFKYQQFQAGMAQMSAWAPPPEAVTTITAQEATWDQTVNAIGSVAAVHGVVVSADLPGVVESINFESGRSVQAGTVLVRLDTRQERAQAAAAEARRDLTRLEWDRAQGLHKEGVMSQSDYDIARANLDEAEAMVSDTRAAIDRKTIRAPFSGMLGIRQANLGQYLAQGAPIVPLQSLDPIYVGFSVPQQDLARVTIGSRVRATGDALKDATFEGKVTALDSVIDAGTRNVGVQATFPNPNRLLRPGMYVQVEVILPAPQPVIPLPSSAILYAPYGDSIFIVETMKDPQGKEYLGVRQQVVKLGRSRGDLIEVTTGLKAGEQVATSGVFKLRNGAAVVVNNDVQPGASANPKPAES